MRPSETQDLYVRLGLTSTASEEEIRDAYIHLARQWHPDCHPSDVEMAECEFVAVAEAFDTLREPSRRACYDNRQAQLVPLALPSALEIYATFFSALGDPNVSRDEIRKEQNRRVDNIARTFFPGLFDDS